LVVAVVAIAVVAIAVVAVAVVAVAAIGVAVIAVVLLLLLLMMLFVVAKSEGVGDNEAVLDGVSAKGANKDMGGQTNLPSGDIERPKRRIKSCSMVSRLMHHAPKSKRIRHSLI
jgi:hypothetical protein